MVVGASMRDVGVVYVGITSHLSTGYDLIVCGIIFSHVTELS